LLLESGRAIRRQPGRFGLAPRLCAVHALPRLGVICFISVRLVFLLLSHLFPSRLLPPRKLPFVIVIHKYCFADLPLRRNPYRVIREHEPRDSHLYTLNRYPAITKVLPLCICRILNNVPALGFSLSGAYIFLRSRVTITNGI